MNPYDKINNLTLFSGKFEHVSILTHVELSKVMAAILEMPQYVAYQKNVAYAFIKLSAKSHSFNILCTMAGLSYPTICRRVPSVRYQNLDRKQGQAFVMFQ